MTTVLIRDDLGTAGYAVRAVDVSVQKLVKQEQELQRNRSYIQMLERASPFREAAIGWPWRVYAFGMVTGAALHWLGAHL